MDVPFVENTVLVPGGETKSSLTIKRARSRLPDYRNCIATIEEATPLAPKRTDNARPTLLQRGRFLAHHSLLLVETLWMTASLQTRHA
jgi:hypothetical protein